MANISQLLDIRIWFSLVLWHNVTLRVCQGCIWCNESNRSKSISIYQDIVQKFFFNNDEALYHINGEVKIKIYIEVVCRQICFSHTWQQILYLLPSFICFPCLLLLAWPKNLCTIKFLNEINKKFQYYNWEFYFILSPNSLQCDIGNFQMQIFSKNGSLRPKKKLMHIYIF